MKKTCLLWLCPVTMAAGLLWFAGTTTAPAQDRERGRLEERIERLERRVGEVAERQEQMMKHVGPAIERLMKEPQPEPKTARPGVPPPAPQPTPPAPPAGPPCPPPVKGCPCPLLGGLLVFFAIINILIAVWIYTDIRKRGEGHGIFVALALLAGIPTGIIYAIVRIGDKKS
ncbi:MAG: hypothetical protein N2689_10415 [Verrucomicrobiae bacterium]|nr:hypothetical protein [Verrucomicrobiae bacterium]